MVVIAAIGIAKQPLIHFLIAVVAAADGDQRWLTPQTGCGQVKFLDFLRFVGFVAHFSDASTSMFIILNRARIARQLRRPISL